MVKSIASFAGSTFKAAGCVYFRRVFVHSPSHSFDPFPYPRFLGDRGRNPLKAPKIGTNWHFPAKMPKSYSISESINKVKSKCEAEVETKGW